MEVDIFSSVQTGVSAACRGFSCLPAFQNFKESQNQNSANFVLIDLQSTRYKKYFKYRLFLFR